MYTNAFWKDGKVQEQILKDYLARIKLVPQESEDEWSEALVKVDPPRTDPLRGTRGLKLPTLLGAIVIQDRLFATNGFKQLESKRLLIRMKAIPQDAIEQWADARDLEKYQAVVSLINDDSIFVRETFKPDFRKETPSSKRERRKW